MQLDHPIRSIVAGLAGATSPNARAIEAWNTILFDKFCRYQDILVAGLGRHGTALFDLEPPRPGSRVLDVGCGFGDTSLRLASLVGEAGSVLGLDCAQNFIDASRSRAQAHEVSNVEFSCVDVQHADLPAGFDTAYARFGTMFFSSPVAALRNLRASLVDGGRLAMTVWRRREDNPCFHVAQRVVEQFLGPDDLVADAITCGPGPFSMQSADVVSQQLLTAGFRLPTFTRFDAPMCVGRTLDQAVAFASELGPAGETIRLAREQAGRSREEIEAALREALRPYLRRDGVWATSSTWIVTATAGSSREGLAA